MANKLGKRKRRLLEQRLREQGEAPLNKNLDELRQPVDSVKPAEDLRVAIAAPYQRQGRTGMLLRGPGFRVFNNTIIGYDVGIDAEGEDTTISGNRIF